MSKIAKAQFLLYKILLYKILLYKILLYKILLYKKEVRLANRAGFLFAQIQGTSVAASRRSTSSRSKMRGSACPPF
jgi:hypothetical protein